MMDHCKHHHPTERRTLAEAMNRPCAGECGTNPVINCKGVCVTFEDVLRGVRETQRHTHTGEGGR